jgi:hypothetical protein
VTGSGLGEACSLRAGVEDDMMAGETEDLGNDPFSLKSQSSPCKPRDLKQTIRKISSNVCYAAGT